MVRYFCIKSSLTLPLSQSIGYKFVTNVINTRLQDIVNILVNWSIKGYGDYPREKMVMYSKAMPLVVVVGQNRLTIKEKFVRKLLSMYSN